METKSLLIGIVSFIAGALLVSTAATTFDKPSAQESMAGMVQSLEHKTGDAFDQEFITQMIAHHEGAVEMARLAEDRAAHDEIKQLSRDIITAQEAEIRLMQQWQEQWDYQPAPAPPGHSTITVER